MQNIKRLQEDLILKDFFKGKVIVIVGARQVGKTTLLHQISQQFRGKKILKINADNPTEADLLRKKDFVELNQIVGDNEIVLIDEAQRVPDVGITIKLLVDNYKNTKQIIVTGSSTINLLQSTSEPLTGRKYTYHLYPISIEEFIKQSGQLEATKQIETFLRFGMYPEIVKTPAIAEKVRLLREITSSYLFRDILEFQEVKNPQVLNDLLKALALQIGSEVSYTELSNLLNIDSKTVERYIDLLEKSFVVFRLSPFSQNRRREISKNKKILFYDVGIRNALIDNFNTFDKRQDLGHLWENFVISERVKYREYHRVYASQYFWRTYDGSEVDLVENREGKLFGYKIKYTSEKLKVPQKWQEYKNSSLEIINKNSLPGFAF
ncbi:hypothetical protein A2982_02970 [candidate division WWE3 bacterium RIFCSPLOWO2_01_FULL_39_13]|uniref:AAA+ ATPase domain-containing protein n=1 Tax=candidate division WWE3 bacterium RIFCSPLOWO2_01_FULL_39_13 TaxID=1802624 RepID=A0A1F4V1N9_UNCKA|nr:MAG: hypothetical protein A2982_02970 [candidate division WWE3 bacterium RIFCSPLOWO2_01_FULL_39_13]